MHDVRSIFDAARARLAGSAARGPRPDDPAAAHPRRGARARGSFPSARRGTSGVLLVGDSTVMATGEITRAVDPGRRGYTAESARHRAELRAAALRGGFAEGETVHFGWTELDLDAVARGEASGPLCGGRRRARWCAGAPPAGSRRLRGYLDERIELLRHPPLGA